jgi:hypothetical protein
MTLPTYEQREAARQHPAGFSVGRQRWSDLSFAQGCIVLPS